MWGKYEVLFVSPGQASVCKFLLLMLGRCNVYLCDVMWAKQGLTPWHVTCEAWSGQSGQWPVWWVQTALFGLPPPPPFFSTQLKKGHTLKSLEYCFEVKIPWFYMRCEAGGWWGCLWWWLEPGVTDQYFISMKIYNPYPSFRPVLGIFSVWFRALPMKKGLFIFTPWHCHIQQHTD